MALINIFDLIFLVIIILFVVFGWKKGLLLSLCGLVVVVISLVGAGVLANTLQEPVAKIIEPRLVGVVEKQFDRSLEDLDLSSAFGSANKGSLSFGSASGSDIGKGLDALKDSGLDLDEALNGLKEQSEELYGFVKDLLKDTELPSAGNVVDQLMEKALHSLALRIAHALVLIVAFIVLLIVLTILLHALNLVAKLPVLRTFNGAGGAIIGLIKALIVLFVAAWAIKLVAGGLVTDAALEKSYLVRFFLRINPLSLFSRL